MSIDTKELIIKAEDIVQSLRDQTGETVALGVLIPEEPEGLVVAEIPGSYGGAIHVPVDFHFPLHCSAPGKILVAFQSLAIREDLLKRMDFSKHTPSTITDVRDFQAELESVIEKGYSNDVSEMLEGCHCVGVPVFDESKQLGASLWTTGTASKVPVRRFPELAEIMKQGAKDLSLRLHKTGKPSGRAYVEAIVRQARDIMDGNLNRPLDMKTLCENLYISYSWFRRVFKQEVGESPAAYHLNRRMEVACKQLSESDRSIQSIAKELGFKNQNHFSALFKRKLGLSPFHYRQRN